MTVCVVTVVDTELLALDVDVLVDVLDVVTVTRWRMLFRALMNACAPEVTSMEAPVPPACERAFRAFRSAPGRPSVKVITPFLYPSATIAWRFAWFESH